MNKNKMAARDLSILLKLVFFLTCTTVFGQNKKEKVWITGVVTRSEEYCGGVDPGEEELARMRAPVPFKGKKLYVRKGLENNLKNPVIDSVITGDNGEFKLHLPPGNYCLIDAQKLTLQYYNQVIRIHKTETQHHSAVDKACLDEWLKKPLGTFTCIAGKSPNPVSVHIHFPCSWGSTPCVRYHGPYPP